MEKKVPVALIIPPSGFLASAKVFVSLGILRVAACLERAGHPVSVLDLNGVSNYLEVVERFCVETEACIFGLTVVTPQFPAAVRIVEVIREVLPGARCIAGGPHLTSINAAAKRERKMHIQGRAQKALQSVLEAFDVVCAGDGEEAILLALQPDVRGLIDADDPDSALFLQPQTLDDYPYPSRHLVDLNSYQYRIDGARATSYISQLGCPFPCGFCNGRLSPSFRRVRTRSSDNLKEEIRQIYREYGFTAYMDYADEMNLYPDVTQDMRKLIDLQEEVGQRFAFRGFIKSNIFTREQARAFAEAGVRELCVGAESGSDRILLNIQKKSTREQNTRAVELCQEFGIRCKVFCSIGHPGESEETIRETAEWLKAVAPDDFDATVIVCFGGTPYYDFAVEHPEQKGVWVYEAPKTGDKLYSYDTDFSTDISYYKGIPGQYQSLVFTDFLSPERLTELRDALETEVRRALDIPFYEVTPASAYEHSMGVIDSGLVRHSPPSLVHV